MSQIEFIHTERKVADLAGQLTYDRRIGLWRASFALAMQDMKFTHRNSDLVDCFRMAPVVIKSVLARAGEI